MSDEQHHPPSPTRGPRTREAAARLRRAEEVYFEVAGLAPGDRDEAIARLCAADAELQAEVRSLVEHAGRLGSFLDQPALGKDVSQLAAESQQHGLDDPLVGQTLGVFTVARRLASGGMGTVYLAVRSDGQFDQKVAIKVVKRGLDSEQIVRRFTAERRTLAGLDHPNIARLLDGGVTPDGRPFLVMEFVDGVPIDEYCDNNRLLISQRVSLMIEVCKGVHHAHQNLVIHRDIKPSNVLVTAQGVPKLLDFGIAKVISGSDTDADVTADTDRRLTPEYASPEQVTGESLTTASDVYSLGVVLYQLLTGTRPYSFGAKTTDELKRVICGIVPVAPSLAVNTAAIRRTDTAAAAAAAPTDVPRTRRVTSTRLRGILRGDLDNIVLMALRKEPQRRYESVQQLAQDLQCFLAGMPVRARKDTAVYRATKFVRRHLPSVCGAAAAVIALTAATVILFGQARRLEQQRDELLVINQRLEESRQFMQAVLSGAETANQGPDAKLGTVLLDASAALHAAPPQDSITRAAAEQSLGRSMMSLGMLREARPLLESAAQRFSQLADTSDARLDIAVDLAELAFFEGRHAEAEAQFRDLLGRERARANGLPTAREGTLLTDLGAAVRAQGKPKDAADIQRQAIAVRTTVHGEASLPVAESKNNLASALFQSGDIAGAIDQFTAVIATRRSLLRPNHPLIVRGEANLGLALSRAGRLDEAVAMLTSSADAWDRAFGPDHAGRVSTMTSLSQALRSLKRYDEAEHWLGRALEWQQSHLDAGSAQIAATRANLALVSIDRGDDASARRVLESVLPALRAAGVPQAGITKAATEALAGIHERAGDPAGAEQVRNASKLPAAPPPGPSPAPAPR